MKNAVTKKAADVADDEMPELTEARFPVMRRGRFAGKRLALPLSGVRKAAGMTQAQFAEAAGITQGEVSRIEAQEDMRISTLRRYAQAVGAEVEVAFTYKNGTRILLAK